MQIGDGINTYSDATLRKMKKEELISTIRCLEQNCRTHRETLDNQANAIIKFEKEIKEELVELIINYSTTLKTALVIKDRDLIEQCVEEWIKGRVRDGE